jgi:FkbM family methyltransferase
MIIVNIIRIILATTPNFLNGFMMYVSSKSRRIKFKGSPLIEMTPNEYKFLKNAVYFGYSIRKDGNEWEIYKDGVFLRMTTDTFTYYLWNDATLPIYKTLELKGKIVLDVGGYIGDSAVFFHHLGAEKIIIYEPVKEHIPLIMKNIELNHINAEVKNLGVGKSKGVLEVPFLKLDHRFGLVGANTETWEKKSIILEDIKNVILESHADIAKFNCEGCEEAILYLDYDIIRTIPLWLLEMHGERLEKQLLEKFNEAGFEKVWSDKLSPYARSNYLFKKV